MKSLYFVNKQITARFVAAVTVVSLLLSALPASFFVAYAATNLFDNSFESGTQTFAANGWTSADDDWHISSGSGHSGSKKASVYDQGNNDDNLRKAVSTVGYSDIVLSYYYRTGQPIEGDDKVRVEWTSNGSTWNQLVEHKNVNNGSWTLATFNLPAGAENAANFAFRFRASDLEDDNGGGDKDEFMIDSVVLAGDEIVVIVDTDQDTIPDDEDNCVSTPNTNQEDADNDGVGNACEADSDGDTVIDDTDNCVAVPNANQNDADNDDIGDACEADTDEDDVIDDIDNCPSTPNPDQADEDNDDIGDACDTPTDTDEDTIPDATDNCPVTPNTNQADDDEDGTGDVCESDTDEDDVIDDIDNCVAVPNTNQADADNDDIGDACDTVVIDVCPLTPGTQTSIHDCFQFPEDKCPNVPGHQWTNLLCLPPIDWCPHVPGTQDNIFQCFHYDHCPDMPGKQSVHDQCVPPPPVCDQDEVLVDNQCVPVEPVATISLTKIVCEDETMLPNDGFTSIDGNTATNFLAQNEGCALESGFEFQTALGGQDVFVDNQGAQLAPWTTTNPTVNGVTTVTIPASELGNGTISVREVWSDDYIPFTGRSTENPVSAELYCANDAANYDNLEWIQGVTAGNTYHCVAWNVEVPEEPPVEECVNLLANGSFEEPIVTHVDLWDKFLGATTGWLTERISDNTPTTLELHRDWSSNEAAHGAQYAELDGDWSTKISQNVALQNGATYELKWAFAPRHDIADVENQLSVLINGTPVGANGPATGVANMTTANWTQGLHSFVANGTSATITFADAGATSNSYGTFLDDARLCKTADPVPVATVVAEKVVCTTEAALPNWNDDGSAPMIDADTAQDWVDQSDGRCSLVPNWQFEWGSQNVVDPSDTLVGPAGAGWTTFGPTNNLGKTSIFLTADDIDDDSHIWIREVLKDGYIPFTHEATPNNSNNVTAEMYCHTDGLNYDNWDRVDGIETGETYHCVAFNAEIPKEVTQCTLEMYSDEGTVVVERNGYAVPTYDGHDAWTADIPGATWVWDSYEADEIDEGEDQTFTFVETFTVENPTLGDLDLAADNDYELIINGTPVVTFADGGNDSHYGSLAKDDFDVLPYLVDGENTMTVKVKNFGLTNSNYLQNPAGLLYKLVVKGDDTENCEVTTEPEPVCEYNPELLATDELCVPPPPPECAKGYEGTPPNCTLIDNDPETFLLDGFKYEVDGESTSPEAGWTIYAENFADESDEVLSTTTDSNGYYWFEVEAGEWVVSENIPEDWEQVEVEQNGWTVSLENEGPDFCSFDLDGNDEIYAQVYDEEYEEEGYQCDFYNDFTGETVTPETPEDDDDNRSGGGGGTKVKKKATPSVLGASTAQCSMYLFDYMREGIPNDSWEVKKLQLFLNIVQGNNLEVNGIFDDATDQAVRAFQMKYQSEVLTPWYQAGFVPHNNPTGWVFMLTRWKINNIVCPGSEASPTLVP